MNTELLQAQKAIQNAREALRDGDRSAARRWAEQAAKLAPQLEDPWLILAAVANPRASVTFIERALKINPDSPRAHKGMQWALKRLQEVPPDSGGEVPSAQATPDETTIVPARATEVVRADSPPTLLSTSLASSNITFAEQLPLNSIATPLANKPGLNCSMISAMMSTEKYFRWKIEDKVGVPPIVQPIER